MGLRQLEIDTLGDTDRFLGGAVLVEDSHGDCLEIAQIAAFKSFRKAAATCSQIVCSAID